MSLTRQGSNPPGPPPPPPPIPSGIIMQMRKMRSEMESDTHDNSNTEKGVPIAQNIQLDEEFMKNGLVELTILETQRLRSSDEDDIGVLIVSSILQPILQNGPLCGLVALAMAAQTNQDVNVNMIFEEARKRGYSKSGEMFSVQNMANLGHDLFGYQTTIIDTREEKSSRAVLTSLFKGKLVLVPYDADFNHVPAERRGHASHWALLLGITLFLTTAQLELIEDKNQSRKSGQEISVRFLDSGNVHKKDEKTITKLIDILPEERMYVTARQGKSKHIGLWNYAKLMKSNQNLREISPKITQNSEEFVVCPIENELCNQVIILN